MVQDSEICQVELRFSSCVCVYSQEKMCPVHLHHQVYLVDRNILVQKYIFSCLPGTIGHSLVLQLKLKLILDNSAIWLVNRNYKISKYMAEFHPEEHATHVVTQ